MVPTSKSEADDAVVWIRECRSHKSAAASIAVDHPS